MIVKEFYHYQTSCAGHGSVCKWIWTVL